MRNKEVLEATAKINSTIRNNLEQLIEIHGLTISSVCKNIAESRALSVHRTTFTRFMNDPDSNNLPIAFLVACCDYFKLSLDNLFSDHFNPYENYQKFNEDHAELTGNGDIASAQTAAALEQTAEPFTLPAYPVNEIFVENPNSPILKKYLQTYYCYCYSTVSSENKTDDTKEAILSGTLKLEPDGSKCKATLKIDTKTYDEDGNPNYKIYEGNVVVCPSIQSIHCMLHHPEGEFCFLIFRYSHLFFEYQECRIAEVLTTSSTLDKRYPTVYRMILSKDEIDEKDLEAVAPHLWLNYSKITISQKGLTSLGEESEEYQSIVEEIVKLESEPIYRVKEKDVVTIAKRYLTKDEMPFFITRLRSHSLAYRYHKVSSRADATLRELLGRMGYYKKKKRRDM